jgi:hypothetical protein
MEGRAPSRPLESEGRSCSDFLGPRGGGPSNGGTSSVSSAGFGAEVPNRTDPARTEASPPMEGRAPSRPPDPEAHAVPSTATPRTSGSTPGNRGLSSGSRRVGCPKGTPPSGGDKPEVGQNPETNFDFLPDERALPGKTQRRGFACNPSGIVTSSSQFCERFAASRRSLQLTVVSGVFRIRLRAVGSGCMPETIAPLRYQGDHLAIKCQGQRNRLPGRCPGSYGGVSSASSRRGYLLTGRGVIQRA